MIVKSGRDLLVNYGFANLITSSTLSNWSCRLCNNANLTVPTATMTSSNCIETSNITCTSTNTTNGFNFTFTITFTNDNFSNLNDSIIGNSLELIYKDDNEDKLFSRLTFPAIYNSGNVSDLEFKYDLFF